MSDADFIYELFIVHIKFCTVGIVRMLCLCVQYFSVSYQHDKFFSGNEREYGVR